MTAHVRKLIEINLPLKALSAEARREKAIRHGHISTLHVWWARRPLVVARAAVLGALLADEDEVSPEFIAQLCRWEVHDGDPGGRYLLEQARALIRRRFPEAPPKVLDSFAGGGSIPLEALRLGCEAHAVEYNPVAYLILKATLEYPQRYGPHLTEAVKAWGEWVLEQARKELAGFYPALNGETPIAYLWSRTIRCPNPDCGAEIPLFRQFWLARKANKQVALKPIPNRNARRVDFAIVEGEDRDFDPSKGTVSRGNAVCLLCGTAAKDKYLKAEAQAGRMGHRLVAVVTTRGKGQGRNYRLATEADLAAFHEAVKALQPLFQTPSPWPYGLPWAPEEEVEQIKKRPLPVWLDDLYLYNMPRWCDVFNPRQLLALVTFGKWVRAAHREILAQTDDKEFAKAVATYLAFGVDFMANYNCVLASNNASKEVLRAAMAGHHLHMAWDYAETNPLQGEAGSGWDAALEWLVRYLTREGRILQSGVVHLGSAAALCFSDKSFDAVVIDPPYADNVPYADLSDFFYVWLRRTVGDLYPEAFGTPLVPKDEEAVENPARFGGGKKGEETAKRHYQRLMRAAFGEIHRVLKPEGIAVVMFTHRSTGAWERLIQSLLDAGLYPTASWPVHTEMEASTHQRGKGAVRSTVLIACRRRPEDAGTGWYHQVQRELHETVRRRLAEFWSQGLRGADFFIAAICPAVGVFGRYQKVMKPDGTEVHVGDLLTEVYTLAEDFALKQLGLNLGLVDPPTRFYVLWRWAYGGDPLDFDEANKMAKSLGAELDDLTHRYRLIRHKGHTIWLPDFWERLQDAAMARPIHRAVEEARWQELSLIDALHVALFLWRRGERERLVQFLAAGGFHDPEHHLWRVAQALYEVEGSHPSLHQEVTALGQMLPAGATLTREAQTALKEARQLKLFE
jgi:adenine-specific DNA methylase